MDFPWMVLIKEVGPLIAVIFFFIWRDWKREQKLSQQVESLAQYQKDILESLIEKSTTALTQSSECIKWIGRVLEHLVRVCPRIVGRDCDKPDTLK
jgi:ATP-dependent helicase/DNAse subunit B